MNGNGRGLWGLRLLALGLALLAWYSVTGEDREPQSEKVVEVTMRYDSPPDVLLLNRLEKVRVGVRGTITRMRNLNPLQIDVSVKLPDVAQGLVELPLSAANVSLPPGFEVTSIEPNVVQLELDRAVTEILPVRARLEGEPAAGAVVMTPELTPNRVVVRGPESRLRTLTEVMTAPIRLSGHALTFQEQIAVLPPDPLINIVHPTSVTVRVPLQVPQPEIEPEEADG